jgi:hypothetical protein
VLSFRAVAKASKFEWRALACDVEGTLNRVEGKSFFTHFLVKARLEVPAGTDRERATRLLEKSEQVCLDLELARRRAQGRGEHRIRLTRTRR